ncbi:hypothetical protein A3F06_00520 [candidate division TM6 bacterium RIFCSPHIGHO2_12_FULL_36_22]|nr:MAG: hypothetical protein A3F06_00520 [candidate division TM6 bacterium RIFCSPHIGHO2_12_FULL_36_22]
MTDFTTLQSAIGLIAILMAYFPTVTVSGYFQAWFAAKLGDNTAQKLGFQTLDPLKHVSLFGLGLLVYSQLISGLGVGWGQRIPLNPHNIFGSFRDIRRILLFFSGAIIHGAIVFALILFGSLLEALNVLTYFPANSLIIMQLFRVVLLFNIYLLVLFLILGAIEFVMTEYLHKWRLFEKYGLWIQIIVFFMAFLVVSIVFPVLLGFIFSCVEIIGHYIRLVLVKLFG